MGRLTPDQFEAADGVEDWRTLYDGAWTRFRTASFAAGVDLVGAIGVLADAANHHPDVSLQYGTVTVRLWSHDIDGLSERDVALAREISAAARERGLVAEPGATQTVQVTIDVLDRSAVMPFWRAVLGYRDAGSEDLVDPRGRGPSFWFQQMKQPRPERNRIHIDVAVPADEAAVRVAEAVAAGGRVVLDAHAPKWWVLADPEGNEACVATMQGRV